MKTKPFMLPKEERKKMIEALKDYFRDERSEQIGDLGAGLLLDFILEKLASVFYNQGIEDAYQFMNDHLQDLFALQK